jgi:DNA-binding NtrC family response regulator
MSVSILIVDDEEHARNNIGTYLTSHGYEVFNAGSMKEAKQHIEHGDGDIILLDVSLPDGYGPDLLEDVARLPVRLPVILITAYGDIEMAVDAMKRGAHDFLAKPLQLSELEKTIQRAQEIVAMRRELAYMKSVQHQELDYVIGNNPTVLRAFEQARRAAAASVPVLITGESGTGKEILARVIHLEGPRCQKPFIDINCPAIQSTMYESELFGYERGAFTGAEKRKLGLMELADGGVLFLDEISSIPVDIQVKLLRALQEQSFWRVGGQNLIHVDVQVVAASNRDLQKMIAEGSFREDLYYRLKVAELHLPPLRERKEDIPELVGLFIRKINQRRAYNINDVTPRAMECIVDYSWPGNIRQLGNVIESAMLFCDEEAIDITHLPAELTGARSDCD